MQATAIDSTPISRRPCGDSAFDVVLGGGFAIPSWVGLWGLAGSGKSRTAFRWCTHVGVTLCCSLEMPLALARETAASAGAKLERLHIAEDVHPDDFAELARSVRASVLLWDSISELDDDAGLLLMRNVRAWCNAGKRFAVVICHETKDGNYRGPSTFGHAPDYLIKTSPAALEGRAEVAVRKSRFCGRGVTTVPIVAT